MNPLLNRLGIELPIIQAPMAGVSTPAMAAAVSAAGGLGSIGVGSVDAAATRQMIAAVRSLTAGPLNVNVFCHQPPIVNEAKQRAWVARLATEFARYGATPPNHLYEVYESFLTDDAKLDVLVAMRPTVVSFHFGLPAPERIEALRDAGIILFATATNPDEAHAAAAAGIDAIVAQGDEAGGHRGMFDPHDIDDRLGVLALTRLLVKQLDIPILAAGGIMDGAGIIAAMSLGAAAVQMGTAFIACAESSADKAYRAALLGPPSPHTVMTAAISGRPARCLTNRFTSLAQNIAPEEIPDYPIAYDAGKALHVAAKAAGEYGYGAQWAGQGAPLARALPTAELMTQLRIEMAEAAASRSAV